MSRTRMQGLTLVELMISMTLGLVVIGGAISLTLANRQSYRTNEGLSQLQESARTAFELVARDVRQAGVTGCDSVGQTINVLDTTTPRWWTNWFPLRGFEGDEASAVGFGTAQDERVSDTDALHLQGIQGQAYAVQSHTTNDARIIVGTATDITTGDVLIVCDFDHAAIFQVTNYNAGARRVTHVEGTGTPGNFTRNLGFAGAAYPFARNSHLAHFFATQWYVGQTLRVDDGGRALFRRRIGPTGAQLTEEIVPGVTDMQMFYRVGSANTFVEADALATADWDEVNALRIVLTVQSEDTRVSTDPGASNGRLVRTFEQIVTLRNRVP